MNRRRTLATLGIALVPLLFVFTGGWQSDSNGWGADTSNVASTTSPLSSAQDQLAACQAALTARNPRLSVAGRDWAQRCIEVETAAIRVLGATPTPTPTGSGTPTPSSSPSATPTQTTASPTPAPTTTSPSPSPTVTSPSPSPTATSPSPSPTPTPPAEFPGPNNTGPRGATLLPWPGCPANGSPAAITTAGLHLNQVIINCDVRILTTGVVITFSKVNGSLYDEENSATRSFTVNDSEIDGGINHNAAVWHTNLTALRDNIHGGITGVSCVDSCHVEDSWIHGQRHDPNAKGQHYGGVLSNGGGDAAHPSLFKHNTIVCDVDQVDPGTGENDISSCSGDINLFGDFGPVSHYTFDNNFLGAGTATGHPSLCAYGGSGKTFDPNNITYINNVFERGPFNTCGFFGPVGNWDPSRPNMVWINNRYTDGAVINP